MNQEKIEELVKESVYARSSWTSSKIVENITTTLSQAFDKELAELKAAIDDSEIDLNGHEYALAILLSNIGLPKESQYSDISNHFAELKKHKCEDWFNEAMGCSICSKTILKSPVKTLENVKELIEHTNAKILEQGNTIAELKAQHQKEIAEKNDVFDLRQRITLNLS